MIDKLKSIYPSLTAIEQADKEKLTEYAWFQSEREERFGILKEELSPKELELLQAVITPIDLGSPSMTEAEEDWAELLFRGNKNERLAINHDSPFRFLFFSLQDPAIDPSFFKEAIHGFFPEPAPVLWENSQEGVIVEYLKEENELPFYFDIAEVLMSDFYINLKLAIGPPIHDLEFAQREYNWMKKWSSVSRNYSTRQVIDYRDVTTYLFLDQMDVEMSERITDMILKETKQNPELLRTIETFLTSNSNATLAAKKLYMHRNSLQYRVDKFIEQTGIDVKQFDGAVTVFLALGLLAKK